MRLFLSHSGSDSDRAAALKKRLLAAPAAQEIGLEVWLDLDDLRPGSEWQPQLEQAIEQADAFAVLIGGAGVVNWVDREVRLGLGRATGPGAIPFIPIRDTAAIDWQALPPFARQFHGVTDPLADETALATLITAISGTANANVALTDEPFVGLRAMDEAEADRFFGRDDETAELAQLVRSHAITAVVADSGSGKSSLVRAGLIPAFRGGVLAGSDRQLQDRLRHVVVMRPGADPLQGLRDGIDRAARTLGRSAGERRGLRLGVDPANPGETAYALRADLDADSTDTLLVVDQFEELLTQTTTADANIFVDLLMALADPRAGFGIRVVLTVRADYYNLIRRHPALFDALEADERAAQLRLKRISDAGLADVVHRALSMTGHDDVSERDALLAAITRDTTDRPGDLALIQMALYATWRHASRNQMGLLRAYSEVHGVLGALAFEAERARTELLDPGERDRLLPLFARLVTLGDTGGITRRGARLDELGAERGALARKLASEESGRLLMITDEVVEVAHEALVAQWPWLQEQIQSHAADIRTLSTLSERTETWTHGSHRASTLPNASELTRFKDLARSRHDWPSDDERNLIRAASRRRTLFTGLSISGVVAVIAAGVTATYFAYAANEARLDALDATAEAVRQKVTADDNARRATAAQQAALAQSERATANAASAFSALALIAGEENDTIRATKLALAAWPETQASPIRKGPDIPDLMSRLVPKLHAGTNDRDAWSTDQYHGQFSADGRYVLAQIRPGRVLLLNGETGDPVAAFDPYPYSESVAFSPDGNWLAVTAHGDHAQLISLDDLGVTPIRIDGQVTAVAFSPDSQMLMLAEGQSVHLHEIGTSVRPKSIPIPNLDERILIMALSPDKSLLALYLDEERPRLRILPTNGTAELRISGAGEAQIRNYPPLFESVVSLEFDPVHRVLWVGLSEERHGAIQKVEGIRLSENPIDASILNPRIMNKLPLDYGYETSMLFRNFAKTPAAFLSGEIFDHIRLPNSELLNIPQWHETVLGLAMSDDHSRVAVFYSDATVHIWSTDTGGLLHRHYLSGGPALDGVFLDNDRLRLLQGVDNSMHVRNSLPSAPDQVRVVTLTLSDAVVNGVQTTLVGSAARIIASPNGSHILAGEPDDTLVLLDIATGQQVDNFWPAPDRLDPIALAPNAESVAIWRRDAIAVFAKTQTDPIFTIPMGDLPTANYRNFRYTKDGAHIVANAGDRGTGWLAIWDAKTGETVAKPRVTFPPLQDFALADTAPQIWTDYDAFGMGAISFDQLIQADGSQLFTDEVANRSFELTLPGIFYANDTRLAYTIPDGIAVLDTATGATIAVFPVDSLGSAYPLAELPDGQILVQNDFKLEAWDLSGIPAGNAFQVACALLPDHGWTDVLFGSMEDMTPAEICPPGYNPPAR